MNKQRYRKLENAYKEYLYALKEATKIIEARKKICDNFRLCYKCPLNIDPTAEACCEVDYAIAKINTLCRRIGTALHRNGSEIK